MTRLLGRKVAELVKIGRHDDIVCPRSLDPIYIVTYCIKWVKTYWTDSTRFVVLPLFLPMGAMVTT